MDFSFINIKDIFTKHFIVLKKGGWSNFIIFVIIPLILAISSFLISQTNDNLDGILSTLLSVFIGLFINLLVLIVSVTRGFSKHKKRIRVDIIEEMFYNITFVITISLFALVLILLKNIDLFSESRNICIFENNYTYNEVIKNIFSFIFVFLFSEIVLTIILIVKRIFRLFAFDIEEIQNNLKKEKLEEQKKHSN